MYACAEGLAYNRFYSCCIQRTECIKKNNIKSVTITLSTLTEGVTSNRFTNHGCINTIMRTAYKEAYMQSFIIRATDYLFLNLYIYPHNSYD
jgi:hypothetical protein